MLPPLRFYSSVPNVDASPDALARWVRTFCLFYVPIGAFHVRSRLPLRSYWSVSRSITPVPTFLLERFAFDHACPTFLLERFAFDHACCLTHSAKQNGLRNVSFLFRRGSGSPVVRSRIISTVIRLSWFTSGLCVSLRRSRRKTRRRGNAEGRRTESAARRGSVFAQAYWPCHAFRGEYVGATRPKPAPKSHWLSGLSSFDSRCECVLRSEGARV